MYENIFESLDHEVAILRKAIEDGVYGTRSIVGDQCLRIESEICNLKKTVAHLTSRSSRAAGTCADWKDCPLYKPPPA